MRFEQKIPHTIADLHVPVTEKLVGSEPVFRRGTPDFVAKMGGDYARRLLQVAESLSMVTDSTRIMAQKTPFVHGAYPDIPQWHVDCVPGVPSKLLDAIQARIDGLICVVFERAQHRHDLGTLFLQGSVDLDMTNDSDSDYKPASHLSMDGGPVNWIHPQVDKQLGGSVQALSIIANKIYRYTSADFHKAPAMMSDHGFRLVLRLNTPSKDFPFPVPMNNEIISPEPRYVFKVNDTYQKWRRLHVLNR
ncbi:MAG: hypothetical protein HOO67_05650 [Candidatus Peribacteraceae bacterium]|nr:hypothetical protein [Candidatus Peribacteraceae bacterium]